MPLRSVFFLVLAWIGQAHAADVALVDSEMGHALLIQNRGQCYALLPDHVANRGDRIALSVPSPVGHGAAEVFWRDPENDIALAYVEGDLAARCQLELSALSRDLSPLLQSNERGLIKSVHFDGQFFDRLAVTVVDVNPNFVRVLANAGSGVDGEIIEGMSGAALTIGQTISGIAIAADRSGTADFFRMDRILPLIAAPLNGARHPQTQAIPDGGDGTGHGFRMTGFVGGANAEIASLETGGSGAAWSAPWSGQPVQFEITLSNDTLVPVRRIAMSTNVTDEAGPPRRIGVEVDRGLPGAAYWTPLAAPDMSPTGVFDLPTGGTVARRVRIRIVDVWDTEKQVRIDGLLIE